MKKIVIIAAALFAAPFAQPASAQGSDSRVHVVTVADLDLSRAADIGKLDRRIRNAVREACGTTSDADLAGKNEARRCRVEIAERIAGARDNAIALSRQPSPAVLASQQ